jgi:hypothetical protein
VELAAAAVAVLPSRDQAPHALTPPPPCSAGN